VNEFISSIVILPNKMNLSKRKLGSSLSLPAHGLGGARATTITPPPEKFCPSAKQAGKKEGGLGEGIFARLLCPPKADWGWEAALFACLSADRRQQRGKARKNCFLN